jgi:acyl-CoA thioesterase
MSDFGPVPVARPPGTLLGPDVGYPASLDHAVWFHRPFLPDQWHRYEVRSLNNSDARGLVGRIVVRQRRRAGGQHQPRGIVAVLVR